MNLNIDINSKFLVEGMSKDELLELILDIDLRVAEEDFTLAILKKLVDSLKKDGFDSDELKKELFT